MPARTYRPLAPPPRRPIAARLGLLAIGMPLFGALAAILVGIVGADAVYTDKLPAAATCKALRATMISTLISAAEIWRRPASRELDDFARR